MISLAILTINGEIFPRETTGDQRGAYEIRGTASEALVTYTLPDLEVSEAEFVDLSWRSPSLTIPGRNRVILTAANPEDTGPLECVILLNGAPWRQDSAGSPVDQIDCGS